MCSTSLKTDKSLAGKKEGDMQDERVLFDMFPSLEREVVSNVFQQCKQDLDASINYLLEMTSTSTPRQQQPSNININQYGFVIRDDNDEAKSKGGVGHDGEKKDYLNASFWGGTNTYSYDAPQHRGEGLKPI